MKDLSYYTENPIPRKTRREFKYDFQKEIDEFVGTREDIKNHDEIIDKKIDNAYIKNMKKYNEFAMKLRDEFKRDLAEEMVFLIILDWIWYLIWHGTALILPVFLKLRMNSNI